MPIAHRTDPNQQTRLLKTKKMRLDTKRKHVRRFLDNHADIQGSKKFPDKMLAKYLYQYKNSTVKHFNEKEAQQYLKDVCLEIGSVYAIGNLREGYVKIGYSTDVETRLKQIQTGCPFEIEIIKEWPGLTRKDEHFLHSTFSKHQAYGEWFKIKGRLKRELLD